MDPNAKIEMWLPVIDSPDDDSSSSPGPEQAPGREKAVLSWDSTNGAPVAKWEKQPSLADIETVCRRHLALDPMDGCRVKAFSDGTFSKLYLIKATTGKKTRRLVMRVSLPVDPRWKTLGEAMTLGFVRRTTSCIPIPKIVGYADSADNEIGFEYTLTNYLPGVPAHMYWHKMSTVEKKRFVEKIAEFQSQLVTPRFESIGTLIPAEYGAAHDSDIDPVPGHMVHPFFFEGDKVHFSFEDKFTLDEMPRGPFSSSHDWLSALLKPVALAHQTPLDQKKLAKRLLAMVPKIFPVLDVSPTIIARNNMSLSNIIVDEDDGSIAGIVGWSSATASPMWMECHIPAFLASEYTDRKTKPERWEYKDLSWDFEASTKPPGKIPVPDLEGKDEAYWHDLMAWEMTELRGVYCAKMKQLGKWDCDHEKPSLKRDFWAAVGVLFRSGRDLKDAENWVDQVEKKGDFKSPRLQKPLFWKDVQKKDGWQKEVEEDEMDVDIVASYGEESQAKSGKRHKRGPSEVTASTRTTARSGSSPKSVASSRSSSSDEAPSDDGLPEVEDKKPDSSDEDKADNSDSSDGEKPPKYDSSDEDKTHMSDSSDAERDDKFWGLK